MDPRVHIVSQGYLQKAKNYPVLPVESLMLRALTEDVTTLTSDEVGKVSEA